MSTGDPAQQTDPWRKESERTGWYGWIAFAGIMMFVLGIFHALIGLSSCSSRTTSRRRQRA